jgi:hypothetical protein
LAGQVIDGGVLSSIVIICTHVPVLPQSSVALQVRVIVDSCGHDPAVITSPKVIVGVASQLSVAVAVPVLAGAVLAVQVIVTLGGQVIEGAMLSSTVMVCTQVLLLPQSSVARHVRAIEDSCGQPPGVTTSVKVMVGVPSQLSVAVALPVLPGAVLAVH